MGSLRIGWRSRRQRRPRSVDRVASSDGRGFVALNGSFRAKNRSPIGQNRASVIPN